MHCQYSNRFQMTVPWSNRDADLDNDVNDWCCDAGTDDGGDDDDEGNMDANADVLPLLFHLADAFDWNFLELF